MKPKIIVFILTCLVLFGCRNKRVYDSHHKVYIENKNGKYTLIRNGKPYFIKGAAGSTHLRKLSEIGGNTIRTYDTTNLEAVLDEAEANHVAVVVGMPLIDNRILKGFYSDTVKVAKQFIAYKQFIEKYKNHPAVLMWCMGNEQTFRSELNYRNFYSAYNNLVDMAHEVDPDHPVTTTIIDVSYKDIFNIKAWTNIDLISINSFGGIHDLEKGLNHFSWFWNEPYMILEWGINGPWATNEARTNWQSYIEPTSSKKAEQYLQIYKQHLPLEDPRLLGSFVFYWGQKQEYTHTWFSMFDENGDASETVGVMQYIWTGKWPEHTAAEINYMLVDKKGAASNLIYKPGQIAKAEIILLRGDSNNLNVKWELCQEDWYMKDRKRNTKKPIVLSENLIKCNGSKAVFRIPSQEGAYRLFATIFDKPGNFSTCNTPFYVVK